MFLTVKGKVKPGRGKAKKKLGFPTINISFPRSVKSNQWGIYFSLIKIDNKFYPGITHLGPVKSSIIGLKSCETYILNLNEDLYGKSVEKRLIFKFREIEKFPNWSKLRKQIKKDVKAAKKFFGL